MRTIHAHPDDSNSTRQRRRRTVASLVLGGGLLLATPGAGASDPAGCHPLAADVGAIAGASAVLPAETIEAMMAPVDCASGGAVEANWPAEADVGGIVGGVS